MMRFGDIFRRSDGVVTTHLLESGKTVHSIAFMEAGLTTRFTGQPTATGGWLVRRGVTSKGGIVDGKGTKDFSEDFLRRSEAWLHYRNPDGHVHWEPTTYWTRAPGFRDDIYGTGALLKGQDWAKTHKRPGTNRPVDPRGFEVIFRAGDRATAAVSRHTATVSTLLNSSEISFNKLTSVTGALRTDLATLYSAVDATQGRVALLAKIARTDSQRAATAEAVRAVKTARTTVKHAIQAAEAASRSALRSAEVGAKTAARTAEHTHRAALVAAEQVNRAAVIAQQKAEYAAYVAASTAGKAATVAAEKTALAARVAAQRAALAARVAAEKAALAARVAAEKAALVARIAADKAAQAALIAAEQAAKATLYAIEMTGKAAAAVATAAGSIFSR